jgi:transketolase
VDLLTLNQRAVFQSNLRRSILEQSFRAGVGHVGSALSIADLVTAVTATFPTCITDAPNRARFVLSKGNSSLAWYAALELSGVLSSEELGEFCRDGSSLGVQATPQTNGVDFSNGSPGMGLSFATGSALASKLRGEATRTIVIMSDAECNEGVVWESAIFGAEHQLDRLLVVVDHNRHRADAPGYVDPTRQADRWRSFGWAASVCDGHDVARLSAHMRIIDPNKPKVLITPTTYGSGVSFMENDLSWRYRPMSRESYEIALRDLAQSEFDRSAR